MPKPKPKPKPNTPVRYTELDRFNAIGCLAVVLLHTLSLAVTGLEPQSWQLAFSWVLWQLAAYAVPGFLFISALKVGLLTGRADFSYGRFLLGRAKKILLPYVIANLIYYVCFRLMGAVEKEPVWTFFGYLVRGNLSSQFYYVVIVCQFWLLIPLWRWTVRRVPWPAAVVLGGLVTFLASRFVDVLALWGVSFPWMDRVFPTYLVFWMAGLYVGEGYDAVRAALRDRRGWALPALLCWLGFALLSWGQFVSGQRVYDLAALKVFADFGAILFLLWLCLYLDEDRCPRVCQALGRVHRASWFIFLYHCLPLTAVTVLLGRLGVQKISLLVLCRFLAAFGVPFGLYELWLVVKKRLPQKR